MMRYALERKSYRGSTSAISVELPKGKISVSELCREFGVSRFRQVFNYERPHEGLNNATPGNGYQPSSVLLPRNPIEFVYPLGFMLSRVNNSGDISWHKCGVFIRRSFDLKLLASSRSMKTSTRSIFVMLNW
jgi:hypothetical protein